MFILASSQFCNLHNNFLFLMSSSNWTTTQWLPLTFISQFENTLTKILTNSSMAISYILFKLNISCYFTAELPKEETYVPCVKWAIYRKAPFCDFLWSILALQNFARMDGSATKLPKLLKYYNEIDVQLTMISDNWSREACFVFIRGRFKII